MQNTSEAVIAMLERVKSYLRKEDGAVTVDWVVLCAGVVLIAAMIVSAMQSGAVDLSDGVASYMSGWAF